MILLSTDASPPSDSIWDLDMTEYENTKIHSPWDLNKHLSFPFIDIIDLVTFRVIPRYLISFKYPSKIPKSLLLNQDLQPS